MPPVVAVGVALLALLAGRGLAAPRAEPPVNSSLGRVWHGFTPLRSCSALKFHGGATLLRSFCDVWQERCS
jgi:hypothetical protein